MRSTNIGTVIGCDPRKVEDHSDLVTLALTYDNIV